MASLTEWVASVGKQVRGGDSGETSQGDGESTRRDEPETALFACSDCNAVYIATSKSKCKQCDTTVEEVPSTTAGRL